MKRVGAIWHGLCRSFLDFPVEALISIAAFVLAILCHEDVIKSSYPFIYFFPLLILSFCLHRFSDKKDSAVWTACYWVSALLLIPLFVWEPRMSNAGEFVLYLIAFMLLFASGGKKDDEGYAKVILHTMFKGITAVLVAGVVSLTLLSIIYSVDFLFVPDTLNGRWYRYPQLLIWLVAAPMLCCSFVSEARGEWKGNRFLTIVVEYILTPALLVYSVILYAYILRILVLWRLPDGGVAYLVSGFIGVALVCRLLEELLTTRHFDLFYKCFPYIALSPLVLLWIGIVRRVGEYGLTEMRVYLIAISLLMTLFTLMLLLRGKHKFLRMSLIVGAAAVLLTYIPGIRASDIGIRSQGARLDKVLPDLLVDGKFPEKAPYNEMVASEDLQRKWETAESALDYLRRNMGWDEFEKVYGPYGQLEYSQRMLEKVRENPNADKEPLVYKREKAVALDGYTLLLPDNAYYIYEDDVVVIFYEDKSKQKELLRCNIIERLDSPDEEKTVFRNDKYMAVFDSIGDCRETDREDAFYTRGIKLYARP
ncbi:MAG: DUF4153 domain-containing protein [Bacteroidales bacterium]|nr:DUF4153 domain-containing protein [Bacteroidales bacterium]